VKKKKPAKAAPGEGGEAPKKAPKKKEEAA
jgi:hypothetical protein